MIYPMKISRIFVVAAVAAVGWFNPEAKADTVYAQRDACGLMGYRNADGEWFMRPCATRLDADSAYVDAGKEYAFVVEIGGKKGVVTSAGDFIIEPCWKDVQLLTSGKVDYGPGHGKVVPRTEVKSAIVGTGRKRWVNEEILFLDLESGANLFNRSFFSDSNVKIKDKDVDINRETGIAVIHYYPRYSPQQFPEHRAYLPAKFPKDARCTDSIIMVDFNGEDIRPGTSIIYNKKTQITCDGKSAKSVPVGSVLIDDVPCIVELVPSSAEDFGQAMSWGKDVTGMVKGVSLSTPSGTKVKSWDWTGSIESYAASDVAIPQKERESPPVLRIADALRKWQKEYPEKADANHNRMSARGEDVHRYFPFPDEWRVAATSSDGTFSIVEYGGRQGIVANEDSAFTVACAFDEIVELNGYPGVFTLRDCYGVGLSDGNSVTIPTGFKYVKPGDNGLIEMRQVDTDKWECPEYVEYADSSGAYVGNNLQQMVEDALAAISAGRATVEKHAFWNIQKNAEATGRKYLRPYVAMLYALNDEKNGNVKSAYTLYKLAIKNNSSLSFAMERLAELEPVYNSIIEKEIQAYQAREAVERAKKYEVLSQMMVQLGNTFHAVRNLHHQAKVARRSSRSTATTAARHGTTGSTRGSSASGAVSHSGSSPSAAGTSKSILKGSDVWNRNRDHNTYNSWGSKLMSMKYRNWPYSSGYTMEDVRNAQNHMRSIRQQWEAKGMWPFSKHSMEDWDGL